MLRCRPLSSTSFKFVPLSFRMLSMYFSQDVRGITKSMYITNSIGDSMLPWRTPDSAVNHSPLPMFVLTMLLLVLYVLFIAICRSAGTLYSAIAIHSLSLGNLSKAFQDPEQPCKGVDCMPNASI